MAGRYDGSDGGHTKWLSEASGLGASSESSHDQTEPSEREIRWTVKSAASVAAAGIEGEREHVPVGRHRECVRVRVSRLFALEVKNGTSSS